MVPLRDWFHVVISTVWILLKLINSRDHSSLVLRPWCSSFDGSLDVFGGRHGHFLDQALHGCDFNEFLMYDLLIRQRLFLPFIITRHLKGTTKRHLTVKTKRNLTGTTKRHLTGTTKRHLTGTTKRHLTGTTKRHLTGKTKRHLMGKTKRHLMGKTKRHLTGTTKRHLTGTTKRHQQIVNEGDNGHLMKTRVTYRAIQQKVYGLYLDIPSIYDNTKYLLLFKHLFRRNHVWFLFILALIREHLPIHVVCLSRSIHCTVETLPNRSMMRWKRHGLYRSLYTRWQRKRV